MWTGNDQGFNGHQLQIVVVTSVLLVISTVAVVLRLLARRVVKVALYPDDYVIVVGLVCDNLCESEENSSLTLSSFFHMEIASVSS